MKHYSLLLIFIAIFIIPSLGCSRHRPQLKKSHQYEISASEKAKQHFKKGLSFISKNKKDKYSLLLSAQEFAAAILIDPSFEKAHLNLGLTYHHLGENELAVKRFEYVLNHFKGDSFYKASFNLGLIYYRMGKLDRAMKKFELARSSGNTKAAFAIGLIHSQKKEFKKAAAAYQTIIQKDPNNYAAYYNLGILSMNRGKSFYEKAQENFLKTLSLNPKNPETLFQLGTVYYSLGKLEKSAKTFKKAAEFQYHLSKVNFNIGRVYYDLNSLEEAIKYFKIASNQNSTDAMLALSKIYFGQNNYELAKKTLQMAVQISPENDQAHAGLGIIYQKKGDYDKAIESYRKALELSEKNVIAHNNLAIIYREMGDIKKSIAAYNNLLKVNPTINVAHRNLGIIYDIYLNNLEKAEYHYKQSIANNTNDPDVNKWLDEVGQRKGKKL